MRNLNNLKRVVSGVLSVTLLANFGTIFPMNAFANEEIEEQADSINETTGHRYQLIDTSMSWTEAEEYCESLGGHLVTVNSSDEQQFIVDNLLTIGTKNAYFIGMYRDDIDSDWKWVTNESTEFFNWDEGEPSYTDDNYVYMYGSNFNSGSWKNTQNYVEDSTEFSTANIGYICEWEAEESEVEVERRMKNYALFSASSSTDFSYSGWKSNIIGNIYSGSSFKYGGSEFSVTGRVDTVNSISADGWKIEINERNENIAPVEMEDFDKVIHDNAQPYDYYEENTVYIQDLNVIDKSIKISGDVEIGGTTFEGDCYIIADGNITYNVNDFNSTGRVFLYSQNGNITINGTNVNINGGIYAPNGNVSFNIYETNLNGFVWADSITYSGSIFNVTADNFDMLEPRSVVKTYTIDADFNEGQFNGLGLDVSDELTLTSGNKAVVTPSERIYGDSETGKGVKVTYSTDKSAVTGDGDNVTVKYGLGGFGEADVTENAVDLIIVVDESGSMAGNRMTNTKSAAKQIISQMKEVDRCAVVGFTGSSNVKQNLTSDKDLLNKAVDKLYASGGTAIYSGIDKALAMFDEQSEDSRQKYIILLSDGEDGYEARSLQSATTAGNSGIRIFSMKIGSGTLQMQNIAINSNGIYKNAPTADDIVKIMSYFASEVFNVAGRNTTFKTTIKDINSVDISSLSPEPSKIMENDDGSVSVEWNFDRITIDEEMEINIPLTVTGDNNGFVDLLENTSCVYYDRNGKPNVIYAEDASLPISDYVDNGNWTVIFDSERETVEWDKIYWNGNRYGDGEISVYVSSSNDGENFSEPVKIENFEQFSGVVGRYAKISVDMKVSADGRTPELYDITIVSKDAVVTDLENNSPVAEIVSKNKTKVNVPMTVRANLADDCLKSNITVSWDCESDNLKFSGSSELITSVICSETGSYEIICTVNDGEKTVQSSKTIVCEPADSYANIDPDNQDEAAAPEINVVLPKYADRKETINAQIEKLNDTEISWYSVIFNGNTAVDVTDDGAFSLVMPNKDGTYKVVVRAFDWAGKSDVKEYSIIVDSTVAAIEIKPSSEETTINSDAYFKVSVAAAHKFKEIVYTLNGKQIAIPEDGILPVDTNVEAEYVLEANGITTSGKTLKASAKITVIEEDSEKPIVNITFDKNSYNEKQNAVITVKATDNVGVTSLVVLLDGKEIDLDGNGQFEITNLKYGEYVITANAYDEAGNNGSATKTLTVKDVTKPTLSLTVDKTEIDVGETVNISVDAADNNGVVNTVLTVNDKELELSEDNTASFKPDTAGTYTIKAVASDPSGNTLTKKVTVTVKEVDTIAPIVTISFDKDTYFETDDIVINVSATDNVGVTDIALLIDGTEVELNAENSYTIKKAELKNYTITAKVYDEETNEGTATETVVVNEAKAPEINVTFDKDIYNEGDSLQGLVTVQGQSEIISLTAKVNNQPLALENGIFTLSNLEAGEYTFTFTAEDVREKTSTINKTITVLDEEHKADERLYAVVDGLVEYGKSAMYKVTASDDIDKSTILVTLNGEKIELTNEYTYEFKGEKLFTNEFILTAETVDGEILTVKNSVLVYETEKPTVTVVLNKDKDIQEHDDIVITITAEDISGIRKIQCLYDGVEIPLDENGQMFINDFEVRPHSVVIRAWDNFGNLRSYLLSFYVVETEVSGGGSVSVGGNTEDTESQTLIADIYTPINEDVISCPSYIFGRADGTEFEKYRLEYQSAAGGDYVLISEGTEKVNNGSLGEFDTTMLRNGLYNIKLTVWGKNGEVTSDEIIVSVEGEMKIGNFSLDFQDMDLNVAGAPVTVIRGYDSRDRNISGDFGYGWNLSTCGVTVTKSCDLSRNWDMQQKGYSISYTPTKPHIISVNWGNGKVEKFVMEAKSDGASTLKTASFTFKSMDGSNSELFPNITTRAWIYENGYFFKLDEEWDDIPFNPDVWQLNKADGTKYLISCTNGILAFADANGNQIKFNKDGIENSDGEEISINRDSNDRITSIVSPTGKTVSYEYDENGDLVKVIDISGYETTFEYDNHYLTAIIDPRGVTVSRNIYDDNGRLIKTIDADGNEIVYDHDIDGREETITDRNGGITRYVYDHNGNVTSQTDPMGNTVKNTYDSNGNLSSKTDAMGNVTNYSYDDNGNMLGMTDAEGNTVTNEYNSKGFITSINAMGIDIMSVTYDEKGNTSSTIDALGNEINYSYDSKGNLESVTDEIGTYMNMTYDSKGNVISATNGAGTTAEFTYDSDGNCLSKTLTYTSGEVTKTVTENYTYDESGNLVKIIDSDGNITTTEYNSIGKISVATDEKGRQTSYDYDSLGNVIKITYADGTSESFTYDREGNNLTATDRLGRTVTMKYDKVGNLISKTYPNGAAVKYTYDANYNLTSTISASGNETKYEYDAIGRNTVIIDALGNHTEFTYNSHSQLSSMTDANGNVYTYTYDDNGNRTATTYPDGSSVSSAYDARGRVISQTDQHGYTTSYTYDGADRLTSVTDALSNVTSYTYNEVGNLIKVTDANNHSTLYTYDDFSRVIKTTNALGQTAEVTYDICGNVLTSTDFGGKLTSFTYDEFDRVIEKKTADGTVTYSYTTDGKLSSVTDKTGTTKYTYDSMDGLKKAVYPNGEYVEYTYDDASRLTGVKTSYGTTSYEYDKLDRLVRVVDRNGYATVYEYDKNGNRSAVRYANGIVITYKYDEVNRLICEKALDKQGGIVAQYEYTLGAAGERTAVKELDRTVEYTYDALYRLTSEKITAADETVTEYTYAYDNVSNRILKTENGAKTVYTYNALNQLVKENDAVYKYDDAGNLISTTSADKSATYTYNAENKLIRATVQEGNNVSVEEYEYDYAGNRISKTTGTETITYLNDNSVLTNVLAEFDAGGNVLCYYTIGADLISQERNGKTSFYLYDGHGSVRGLVDESGKITDTYNYDAFGNLLDKTGTTVNNYLYCGEQLDSTTGLYYLRARYLNPATGTFITQDTYAGTIFDPTSLHKYLYANANPVMYIDPSGYTASMAEHKSAMAISNIIDSAASKAASFAWNYYLKFKASIPTIITAVTGMATFVSNNPEFLNICTRIASGDLPVTELLNKILDTFDNINSAVWEQIYETTGRGVGSSNSSGSSGGGSSSPGNFDPNSFKDIVVRAGKNIKDHYLRHKHLLEGITGKKYPKWKESNCAEEFLNDIQQVIRDGRVSYVGNGTLNKTSEVMHIFRGEGITIVTKLNGEFVTLLETGKGMDLSIMLK